MSKWAKIKDGRVVNIVVGAVDFAGLAAIGELGIWAAASDDTRIGDLFDGNSFHAAPAAVPEWRISVGDWKDRLGFGLVTSFAASTHPLCIGMREMLSNRTYVDLRRPDLPAMLGALVAQGLPAPMPGVPDSGPLTAARVAELLAEPKPGEGL